MTLQTQERRPRVRCYAHQPVVIASGAEVSQKRGGEIFQARPVCDDLELFICEHLQRPVQHPRQDYRVTTVWRGVNGSRAVLVKTVLSAYHAWE